jgi:hypothetical protein
MSALQHAAPTRPTPRYDASMSALAPTRATALASPLHRFTGWFLTVNCPGCRVLRTVEVNTLILNKGGGAISIGEAVAKLRCSRCGSAPDWVRLADGTAGSERGPVRQVMLVQDRQ